MPPLPRGGGENIFPCGFHGRRPECSENSGAQDPGEQACLSGSPGEAGVGGLFLKVQAGWGRATRPRTAPGPAAAVVQGPSLGLKGLEGGQLSDTWRDR